MGTPLYRHRLTYYRVRLDTIVEFIPGGATAWCYWGSNVEGMVSFVGTVPVSPLELALLRPEVEL